MTNTFRTLLLAVAVLALFSCKKTVTIIKESPHWEYENPDWQNIGYKQCGGNSQSPVNVETGKTLISASLSGIKFNYEPFAMKIVDNGHTIQLNAPDQKATIVYNDVRYRFLQLHFHRHSEHKINNEASELELHLVHRDSTGNLLVLAYMIEAGTESKLLKQVLEHAPHDVNAEKEYPDVKVDLDGIQPANKSYYTYFGSLTTPPCSASVQFIIFKTHIDASPKQIEEFAQHHHDNARSVQPLNNRIILEKL